jgi:hypothetical protein
VQHRVQGWFGVCSIGCRAGSGCAASGAGLVRGVQHRVQGSECKLLS